MSDAFSVSTQRSARVSCLHRNADPRPRWHHDWGGRGQS